MATVRAESRMPHSADRQADTQAGKRSGGGGATEPEHEQLKVTIEAGWAPGSEQVVQTADGQGVSIMVPADAQPVRETPFSSRFHFKILDD